MSRVKNNSLRRIDDEDLLLQGIALSRPLPSPSHAPESVQCVRDEAIGPAAKRARPERRIRPRFLDVPLDLPNVPPIESTAGTASFVACRSGNVDGLQCPGGHLDSLPSRCPLGDAETSVLSRSCEAPRVAFTGCQRPVRDGNQKSWLTRFLSNWNVLSCAPSLASTV